MEVVWNGTRNAGFSPFLCQPPVAPYSPPAPEPFTDSTLLRVVPKPARVRSIKRTGTRADIMNLLKQRPATVSEIVKALGFDQVSDYRRINTMAGYLLQHGVVQACRLVRISPVSRRAYRCHLYFLPNRK